MALYPESWGCKGLQVEAAIRRLPADERQGRREAAGGERRVALARSELLGGAPIGGDEEEVGVGDQLPPALHISLPRDMYKRVA
jgi:hypothetical protein